MRLNLNLKIPWSAQIRKWHEPEMHQKSSFQRKSGIIFAIFEETSSEGYHLKCTWCAHFNLKCTMYRLWPQTLYFKMSFIAYRNKIVWEKISYIIQFAADKTLGVKLQTKLRQSAQSP